MYVFVLLEVDYDECNIRGIFTELSKAKATANYNSWPGIPTSKKPISYRPGGYDDAHHFIIERHKLK